MVSMIGLGRAGTGIGRFDCTKLNREFILDTGREVMDELKDGAEDGLELPYAVCAFGFRDFSVVVTPITEYAVTDDMTDEDVATIEEREPTGTLLTGYVLPDFPVSSVQDWNDERGNGKTFEVCYLRDRVRLDASYGYDKHDDYVLQPLHTINIEKTGDYDDEMLNLAATLVLGVLCLMGEHLVLRDTKRPGASVTKNARRKHVGERQLYTYHALTLNIAEARRRTHGVTLHAHESPRLHWRRGHWRTLHRLSEFERRTWIKRCLVGDPDKGFVAKHYSLIYESRIH